MELEQEILSFYQEHTTLCLCTIGDVGEPCSAPVFYAYEGLSSLFFTSKKSSQHSVNIAASPNIAASIYKDQQNYLEICGIQLNGRAYLIEADRRNSIEEIYLKRFKFINDDEVLYQTLKSSEFYEIKISWLRYIDNRREFANKKEKYFKNTS